MIWGLKGLSWLLTVIYQFITLRSYQNISKIPKIIILSSYLSSLSKHKAQGIIQQELDGVAKVLTFFC